MRWFVVCTLAVCFTATLQAHHPDRESKPVHQRIDLIGPIGTGMKMSHRRKYNRPSNIGGKIAYYIAPSSQEAMAWHDAAHRNAYKNDRPRIEMHYFYPKPWEALRIGPRLSESPAPQYDYGQVLGEAPTLPAESQPAAFDGQLIQ